MTETRPDGVLDPYYAAYLFRRTLETDPAQVPANLEAAWHMFEGLSEHDALALVEAAAPLLGYPDLESLAVGLSRRDSRPRVRAAWIGALGTTPSTKVRRAVLESLRDDPSPRVKATCLSIWGRVQESIPLEMLRPWLTHADARVRANAVELLVERDQTGDQGVLEVLLNDPSARVAAIATLALWRRGRRDLVRMLAREDQPAVRVAFLHAAGRAGRDRRLRELCEEALEEGTVEEARAAAGALPRVAAAGRAADYVDQALRAEDHGLRTSMLRGCMISDEVATRAALAAALRLPAGGLPGRERYLANALSAARGLQVGADLELVAPLLESEDARVRANAIELVEEYVEVPSLLPRLEKSFREGSPRERANAAVALWRRGSPAALSGLVREVGETGARGAASAAYGLGRMGGTVAELALRRAVSEGDDATRRIAYRFLAEAA